MSRLMKAVALTCVTMVVLVWTAGCIFVNVEKHPPYESEQAEQPAEAEPAEAAD